MITSTDVFLIMEAGRVHDFFCAVAFITLIFIVCHLITYTIEVDKYCENDEAKALKTKNLEKMSQTNKINIIVFLIAIAFSIFTPRERDIYKIIALPPLINSGTTIINKKTINDASTIVQQYLEERIKK